MKAEKNAVVCPSRDNLERYNSKSRLRNLSLNVFSGNKIILSSPSSNQPLLNFLSNLRNERPPLLTRCMLIIFLILFFYFNFLILNFLLFFNHNFYIVTNNFLKFIIKQFKELLQGFLFFV